MRGVNANMFYDDLNTEEQVSYLIKLILISECLEGEYTYDQN